MGPVARDIGIFAGTLAIAAAGGAWLGAESKWGSTGSSTLIGGAATVIGVGGSLLVAGDILPLSMRGFVGMAGTLALGSLAVFGAFRGAQALTD